MSVENKPRLVQSELETARVAAEKYKTLACAKATRKAYDWAWHDLERWGAQHGFTIAVPVLPEVIALWIAQSASEGLTVASIQVALAAVTKQHKEAKLADPCKDPEVQKIWAGIRRSKANQLPVKKAALTGELIAAMVRAIPPIKTKPVIKARDRAILLVGFAGGFRRSEIVQFKKTDVEFDDLGVRLYLRTSKTDQEGDGREIFIRVTPGSDICPVAALKEWLTHIPDSEYLFPFNGRTIANVVKRRAKAIGIDPKTVSGHSLRAGFVTSAVKAGKSEAAIAKITGHKVLETLRGYVRELNSANEGLLK